jgi:sRNA-binding carbon storage regulator CsrA
MTSALDGDEIVVVVAEVRSNAGQAWLGIEAPPEVICCALD